MKIWFSIFAYIACGFLTFGYVYNLHKDNPDTDTRDFGASVAGVFWPIYWPGHLSIKLFDTE